MCLRPKFRGVFILSMMMITLLTGAAAIAQHKHGDEMHVHFSHRSITDGNWSDAKTWDPPRVPGLDDRVLITRGTTVRYDVAGKAVIRLIQVVGTLDFARDRDTELNVGILKVQNSDTCSESGFACDFKGVSEGGEPGGAPEGSMPALLVGTFDNPIPAGHTARIRLHFLEGMNKHDAPAIACCSARMEIHGTPLARTWVELGKNVRPGDATVAVSEEVADWHIGDEVIITASNRTGGSTYREGPRQSAKPETESRRITAVEGNTLTLDSPLKFGHSGEGDFRSEVANLSRNVIVESADPAGERGHTVYHRFSKGGISYARFAHLGKEGVLGRYSIHYHLVGDTMRGSSVLGVAIVDSHNRWVTIHGTQYLVVRDCVGYQSVGHGFFMEDGTEVYNLLDRNLGVQSYQGKRLPNQVLGFDDNEGAAFWWANGRNSLVRNVGCENDQYGFRYDMQNTSQADSHLPILQPDGTEQTVDVRTIPIWRFENNEAHTNFAGMVLAANGGNQPDSPIQDERMLEQIRKIDWTGPDTQHPHTLRNFTIWQSHYAFRPHSPSMLVDGLRIDKAEYGIYRPAYENQVYRNLNLSDLGSEPFNRGMDDASAQVGSITVDGMIVDSLRGGNDRHPFVHMTDNALAEGAECHFRNIELLNKEGKRPLFNLGGSVRVDPIVDTGVPYFIHDYYGPGRHAKIVSVKARHLIEDGSQYREERPLTGDESRVAEVKDVAWPELLDPVDDVPPATIVTSVTYDAGKLVIRGVSHDDGAITTIVVNGNPAKITSSNSGVVDWEVTLAEPDDHRITAFATDAAGNVERTPHQLAAGERLAAAKAVGNAVKTAHRH